MVEVWTKEGGREVFLIDEIPSKLTFHKFHRLDGPAYTKYHSNGKKHIESWYQNGKQHRENGPAYIKYDKDGNIVYEYWFQDDKLHRDDGPAIIKYEGGKIAFVEYCLNGKLYKRKEAFEQAALMYKLNLIKN